MELNVVVVAVASEEAVLFAEVFIEANIKAVHVVGKDRGDDVVVEDARRIGSRQEIEQLDGVRIDSGCGEQIAGKRISHVAGAGTLRGGRIENGSGGVLASERVGVGASLPGD